MTRIENSLAIIKFEDVRLDQVIKTVVSMNQAMASTKQQQLVVGDLFHVIVHGGEILFKQILSNLISSAIKYSAIGATTTLTMVANDERSHISVEVRDEGQGLSHEDFQHLFVKYRKGSSVPTGGETSTGVGLFSAKLLVERMGGTISAESLGKNQGAIFRVEFPMF